MGQLHLCFVKWLKTVRTPSPFQSGLKRKVGLMLRPALRNFAIPVFFSSWVETPWIEGLLSMTAWVTSSASLGP